MIEKLTILTTLAALVICAGCMKRSKADTARETIGEKVVIVLAKEPDPNGYVLDIQDYIRNGESYIPFFSSQEAFQKATAGKGLGKPVWEIDHRLFVALTGSNQVLILDLGLPTEVRFTGQELKQIFPERLIMGPDAQQPDAEVQSEGAPSD